jgi:hypothetical protein
MGFSSTGRRTHAAAKSGHGRSRSWAIEINEAERKRNQEKQKASQ